MQSRQLHRGPDQQSEWSNGRVGLGSARLSVLDLSAAASQPMATDDGRYVLAYNGELYNYQQLRAKLRSRGVSFHSSSHTEVVLMALATFGEKVLPEFDGMFAFAFYDTRDAILLLGRDRAGIKPLHYYQDEQALLFASEIKSIWAGLGDRGLEIDSSGLRDMFSLGYGYGSRTPFRNVKTLDAGTTLRIDVRARKISQAVFYDILTELDPGYWEGQLRRSVVEVEEELEDAVRRSIQTHLVSDAPVGVICSGGVDSSLIAALAREVKPDLRLYHAAVSAPLSEVQHARRVAGHLETPLHVAEIDQETFLRYWPWAIYHNDVPSYHANDVPLYVVCQLARDHGMKVLLSGEGADELFGGYRVNMELDRRTRWRRWLSKVPGVLRTHARSIGEAQVLNGSNDQNTRWLADTCGMASLGRIERFISTELLFQGNSERLRRSLELRDRLAFLPQSELASAGYLVERLIGHLQSLLYRNDRMGMMASIETRIPYLSNELISSWVSMPLQFKINSSRHTGLKFLLKRIASRLIPKEICYRPKSGFPIPLNKYICPNVELFANGFLEHLFRIPGHRLLELSSDVDAFYKLASVELWGRIFFFRDSPAYWSDWLLGHCRIGSSHIQRQCVST